MEGFCLCNAMVVEIPCCGVLELLQGVSCKNWQRSGLQQYLIPSWACPFLTEKLNLAGRKSLKLLLSCIGPKSCSERDKKSGSCLIFRTIAFIWGNKLFPLPHQFCCRISTMSCQTSLSSFVAFQTEGEAGELSKQLESCLKAGLNSEGGRGALTSLQLGAWDSQVQPNMQHHWNCVSWDPEQR